MQKQSIYLIYLILKQVFCTTTTHTCCIHYEYSHQYYYRMLFYNVTNYSMFKITTTRRENHVQFSYDFTCKIHLDTRTHAHSMHIHTYNMYHMFITHRYAHTTNYTYTYEQLLKNFYKLDIVENLFIYMISHNRLLLQEFYNYNCYE